MEKKIITFTGKKINWNITIEKEYEVIREDNYEYWILDDKGTEVFFYKTSCKLKEQSMDINKKISNLREEFAQKLLDLEQKAKKQETVIFKKGDWIVRKYKKVKGLDLAKISRIQGDEYFHIEYYRNGNIVEDLTGSENSDIRFDNSMEFSWRLATNSEILEVLTAVAKKKGFIGRDLKFKAVNSEILKCNTEYTSKEDNKFTYFPDDDILCSSANIYCKGVWAEIVKNKLPDLLGYIGRFDGVDVKYGCKKISKDHLDKLLVILAQIDATGVILPQGNITVEDLQKIVKFTKNE